MTYDCVITGGGPAGTALAAALARGGVQVLLLEKSRYPRAKPCGGGVARKAAALLDFPWQEVVQDTAYRVDFHFGPDRRITVESPEPVAYLLLREDLDWLMARRASRLGADVREGCPVTGVRLLNEGVEVAAGGEVFRGALLACADGVNSFAARRTGLYGRRHPGITLAAELAATPADLARFGGTMLIDAGAVSGGYGWIFPKRRQLSVGVGSFRRHTDIRSALTRFLAGYGLGEARVLQMAGHLLPADGHLRRPVARDRVLLLGDAAALVDPLSGEGIYYALWSAQLAARAILAGEPAAAAPAYQERVDRDIRGELVVASHLARLFYTFSSPIFTMAENHREIAAKLVETVYGGSNYASIGWSRGTVRRLWRKYAQAREHPGI